MALKTSQFILDGRQQISQTALRPTPLKGPQGRSTQRAPKQGLVGKFVTGIKEMLVGPASGAVVKKPSGPGDHFGTDYRTTARQNLEGLSRGTPGLRPGDGQLLSFIDSVPSIVDRQKIS